MDVKQKIRKLSAEHIKEIIQIRQHLHAHPELSFQEYQTSEFICKKLDEWNVSYRKGIAGTGILAELEGKAEGRIIGFRADMDALPVQEENNIPYKSLNEGIMHACGHDVHSASLLGAIRILKELRNDLSGKIKFVFQPGEERIPGGAKLMLEEHLFDEEEPELMIAQHVYPDLEVGTLGFKSGRYMASSDEIYLRVQGKGGHAALPDSLTDPVLISAQILTALQQIVSRNNKPGVPTVLSFGKVTANGSVNVIPDEVNMEGTFRTMDEEWRNIAHQNITRTINNIAKSFGGNAEVEIRKGYPVLTNDPEITGLVRSLSEDWIGKENVIDLDIRMTAEDFAYFSRKYPSVLFRLGVADLGTRGAPLHTSRFNVNEKAIQLAMENFSWIACNLTGK